LERAKHHLDDLHIQMLEWGSGEALNIPPPIGKRYDPDEGCFVYYATEVDTPPGWSVVAGDAIQNLRASLDHLAWLLSDYGAHTNEPDKIVYPTCWDPNSVNACVERRIPGIDPTHLTIVKRYQPCTRFGDLRRFHPFAVLQRLSNDDKHRILLLLPSRNFSCSVVVPETFPDFDVTERGVIADFRNPPGDFATDFTPGTPLLKIFGKPIPGRDPDVKVEWTCSGTVEFADTNRSVLLTIEEMLALARQLLSEFAAIL
jgi:hypothetical protein